ncbi:MULTISPECIES: hypothetical protein [unclassified Acidovorax]|uniref:hypothetical protein n=1 Tax=unclassified Acidovorax TaxID=2684926 RepID=UPI0023DE3B56|nr:MULTISPECIES: hypothetical protein [unclassified Acidovorax]GKS91882.1 hypothetical protein AVTE2539_20975 [Acidovorax sp. SUPP2539]GKS96481.1 hypothetical protein AVAK2825_18120 [Acidovorax sp. SUPP2825]
MHSISRQRPATEFRLAWLRAGRSILATAALVGFGAGPAGAAPQAFPVLVDAAFSKPAAGHIASADTLQAFLRQLHRNRHENRFCFVQERLPPDAAHPTERDTIWMVWTTGARIYTFTNYPGGSREDPNSEAAGLAHSNPVHWKTDVVADEDAVGGSTYLVTRAWVDRIRQACRRVGVAVRVPRFPAVVR